MAQAGGPVPDEPPGRSPVDRGPAFDGPARRLYAVARIADKQRLDSRLGVRFVTRVRVLVAAVSKGLAEELIAAAVARHPAMVLLAGRVVTASEIDGHFGRLPPFVVCALLLSGPPACTRVIAARWLRRRRQFVAVQVDLASDVVQLTVRNVGLVPLLTAIDDLLAGPGWTPPPGRPLRPGRRGGRWHAAGVPPGRRAASSTGPAFQGTH